MLSDDHYWIIDGPRCLLSTVPLNFTMYYLFIYYNCNDMYR